MNLYNNNSKLGHFGDKTFQTITCTGTDNSKQTRENTKIKQTGPR